MAASAKKALPAVPSLRMIASAHERGIWLAEQFLPATTCRRLVRLAEAEGFRPARFQSQGRNNSEMFFKSPTWAAALGARLAHYRFIASSDALHVEASSRLASYRYRRGDRVTQHMDASHPLAPGYASSHTLIVYLSDGYSGGDTVFPSLRLRVRGRAGLALLFNQALPHEGAEVTAGVKYIARLDVAMRPDSSRVADPCGAERSNS